MAAAKTRGLRPKLGWNVIDEVNCPNSQIMYIYRYRERENKKMFAEGGRFMDSPRISGGAKNPA